MGSQITININTVLDGGEGHHVPKRVCEGKAWVAVARMRM